MKKEKWLAVISYLAAVGFYVVSALTFLSRQEDTSMGVMWLCVGSAMLCLGSVWLNKSRENDSDKDQDKKE